MTDNPICDLYAEGILLLRREISENQTRASALENLIASLQAKGTASPEQIEKLETELAQVNNQLESDRGQLTLLQEEFSAECPPRPDI